MSCNCNAEWDLKKKTDDMGRPTNQYTCTVCQVVVEVCTLRCPGCF